MRSSSRSAIIQAISDEIKSTKFSLEANGMLYEGRILLNQYKNGVDQIIIGTAIAALVLKDAPSDYSPYPRLRSYVLNICNIRASSLYKSEGIQHFILKCGELALTNKIPFRTNPDELNQIVGAYPYLGPTIRAIAEKTSSNIEVLQKFERPTILWPSVMTGISAIGLFATNALAHDSAVVSWGLFAKTCAAIGVWGWLALLTVSAAWLARNAYRKCKEDTEGVDITLVSERPGLGAAV